MTDGKDARNLLLKLKTTLPFLYWTVILIGLGVLCGWLFDIGFLKSVLPGHLSMRPNIAIGFILTGIALVLKSKNEKESAFIAACVSISLIGLVSFLEYIFLFDWGFSSFGFSTPTTSIGKANPQRMDLISSMLLFLTGSGLLLFKSSLGKHVSDGAFVFTACVSFLSMVGHLYGIKDLEGIRAYTEMGIHTSIAFLLVCLSVFIMRIEAVKSLSVLLSDTPAGFVARKLIPAAIILPIALGGLKLFGENAGFFSTRFGTAILTSANIFAFICVILWISTLLQKTEKRRIESAKAKKKLQTQNELRDRFISTLSHDLRTPLSVIKMNAEMMLEDRENMEDYAKKILKSSDRIDFMIEGLLDAGKIEAGESLSIKAQECDLDKMIHETLEEMKNLHGGRFLYRSQGPTKGYWDCFALKRALENLVSNAVKYGKEHAPITVNLKRKGSKTMLGVHNFGGYIPKEKIDQLFSSYQRLDSAIKSENQGWGLGLTLVKGVAQAHKGEVKVSSSLENGTTFTLEIENDCR